MMRIPLLPVLVLLLGFPSVTAGEDIVDASGDVSIDRLLAEARDAKHLGHYLEAQVLFAGGRELVRASHEADHPQVILASVGLASIRDVHGDFAGAEVDLRRGLILLERSLGPADPRVVETTIDLATCLGNLTRFERAEDVLRHRLEAVVSQNEAWTPLRTDLTWSLAGVLAITGKHVESTRLYRWVAAIAEDVYGPDHRMTAAALSGLAHTFRRIGRRDEATALYERALDIVEGITIPHPDAVQYRGRLGMCLYEGFRNDEAIATLERAIADATEIFGPDSYQRALEERHLGQVLYGLREWEKAATVFETSLATLERTFGPDHPYLSKCLKGLAMVHFERGALEMAQEYATRAASTHRRTGRDRFELAHILGWKGRIEMDAGRADLATATSIEAIEAALAVQEESFELSSPREGILYSELPWTLTQELVSTIVARTDVPDSTLDRAFSLVARAHGQVLDWLAERQRLLNIDPRARQLAELHDATAAATQHMVDLVVQSSQDHDENRRVVLERARFEEEAAERALSAAIENLRSSGPVQESGPTLSASSLAARMDPDCTLLHFVRFFRWLEPRSAGGTWRQDHYGAFCLRSGDEGEPELEFVDLGAAESLDRLLIEYRQSIEIVVGRRKPTAREEATYRSLSKQLYARIWQPLMTGDRAVTMDAADEADAPLVLLIPDSQLYLLDFNTLLAPSGEPLIEHFKLHVLSSAEDLLRADRDQPSGRGLLAVGNPTFAPDEVGQVTRQIQAQTRSDSTSCAAAYRTLPSLPGAEEEARIVADLFTASTAENAELLVAAAATEEAVKRKLPGQRVAHLAAHGFYCAEAVVSRGSLAERVAHPLLASGLILASDSGKDDGLLTAEEVACLDLAGLDWVVLSACGSGLGHIIGREGPFGLRRAFEIAGARTVVMALWRVDDHAMRELMEAMYRLRLAGRGTIDSIRDAQLARLREQRRRFNRTHPASWGGIITQGSWR